MDPNLFRHNQALHVTSEANNQA